MENRMNITICVLALCIVSAFSAPATRTVDNTIGGYNKIAHENMPHEVQQSFPNLIEITKKLTKLYAAGNPMKLTADIFAEADQIEMINLSGGDVREVESRAFYGPSKLKKLNLSGNKLTTLPRDLFPKTNAVKEIDLSNNRINTLSRSTFRNLRNLKKLNLSNNKLTELDGSLFADLTSLDELDLTGNPIRSISEEFFASLPHGLQLSFDDQNLDIKSLQLTEQWAL
jgi:Leucine-rich repeat (LRR) protein